VVFLAEGGGRLVGPGGDAVYEGVVGVALRVAEARDQPQLLGLPGGVEELLAVVGREVDVLVAVHDQDRHRRDAGRRLGGRHRVGRGPAFGRDPGVQHVLAERPAEAPLRRQVHPAHGHGATVEPAARAADRDDRVHPAEQRRVPEHHGPAHREADRRDALVAELARVPHGHVEVVDLLVAERRQAAGPAVAAAVEGDHARGVVEPLHQPPDHRPLPGHREPVHDDECQIALFGPPLRGKVHGVDRYAVFGDQRHGHDDGIHRMLQVDVNVLRPGVHAPAITVPGQDEGPRSPPNRFRETAARSRWTVLRRRGANASRTRGAMREATP